MNPLMNNMGRMMQVVNQVQQLKQNPQGIANFLKQQGRVSDEQYAQIQKMSSPEQIGQYLMQTGGISQQQAMQAVQSFVPQIQKQL